MSAYWYAFTLGVLFCACVRGVIDMVRERTKRGS